MAFRPASCHSAAAKPRCDYDLLPSFRAKLSIWGRLPLPRLLPRLAVPVERHRLLVLCARWREQRVWVVGC